VLRLSPESKAKRLGQLQKNDTVILLGQHKDWVHVKIASGQTGFLDKTLVKEL
jgi:hypothetical protein